MNDIQTIKLNKIAYKLFQKAKKLDSWSKEVRSFMINSAKYIPISSSELIKLFEVLIFVVDKTGIFPSEAQFRIKLRNKIVYLNSLGDFLEQRMILDDQKMNKHLDHGPISLSKDSDLNPVDFSTFISAYFRGHITVDILKELCSVPEPLMIVWDIELIRTIYLRFSTPKWKGPLDSMHKVQQILVNRAYPRVYIRIIENSMINGARMGFSPSEILESKVIYFLEQFGSKPEQFRDIMRMDWSMMRRLTVHFGQKNDGTTFNQYSLRKFIIPLVSPGSNFTKGPELRETELLFKDIVIRWKEVFTTSYIYTKDLFDNYGDVYLKYVCNNETPENCRKEIIRLLNHIDFISSHIETEKQYKQFLKPLHVQGIQEIRKLSGTKNIQSVMRMVLQKHFEIIEEYTILNFPIDYRQYMAFFSSGFIQSPDDIDFFQNAVRNIRKLDSNETEEILRVMMAHASDVKETQKIIDYISSCKIFDKDIYQRWKDLKEEKQDEAIYSLNKCFDRYILDPSFQISIKELPKMSKVIENAIIKQLIKSPRLKRNEIDHMLSSKITAMEPMVSAEMMKPIEIIVDDKVFTAKSTSKQKFLASRHRFINRASLMSKDELYRDRLTTSMIKAGVYHYGHNYSDGYLDVMNNFQLLSGEINNLTGQAAEIGRECASWVLSQEKDLLEKSISIMEELLLSGIINNLNLTEMAYPPFSEVLEKSERDLFTQHNIIPLKEIYSIYSLIYLNDFFMEKSSLLPPLARTQLLKCFPQANSMAECAALVYKNLSEALNINEFDKELRALCHSNPDEVIKRKIALVGGKRKLDQFFSFAGDMGFKDLFNEIKRKDFIPFRIIDLGDMTLKGYIICFYAYPSDSRKRILLISGIYVKERWISEIDEGIFYRESRKALVKFAKKVDAESLCVTQSGLIHSNNSALRSIIAADFDEKPLMKTSTALNFPSDFFDLSNIRVLWKKKSE